MLKTKMLNTVTMWIKNRCLMQFRCITCLLLALSLSGCLTFNSSSTTSLLLQSSCVTSQKNKAKVVDWRSIDVVEETIEHEVYQEGLINLRVGKPYILRIHNKDNAIRSFRAPRLFYNSSVLKVVHDGKAILPTCLQAVAVEPKKTSEIYLVPLEAGYYDYHETVLEIPFMSEIMTNGSVGLAYVY